jgi:hypothetical protein
VNRHHKALEYDLSCIGVDLLDFWRGEITLRKLRMYIDMLPTHSAFWSSVGGHPDDRWTTTDGLLARSLGLESPAVTAARERELSNKIRQWRNRPNKREKRGDQS